MLSLSGPAQPPEPPLPVPAEVLMAEVTAYTSHPDETDDTPEVNAAGEKPGHGSLACPRRFELGTAFVIEGKRYVCDDRMNRRFTNRFDIWMPSREQAIEFGIQNMPVEIANDQST